jgi:hypothetical protein
MKTIKLKILYLVWNYLIKINKFPKQVEKINLVINKLENE